MRFVTRTRMMAVAAAAFISATVSAQPSTAPDQPAPSPEVVITGARPGTGLIVNIDRIARSCKACRRAVTQLRSEAAPARQRIGHLKDEMQAIRRDADAVSHTQLVPQGDYSRFESIEEVGGETILAIRDRAVKARQAPARREIAETAQPVRKSAANYLSNLMRYVQPIVERHRRERNVERIYSPREATRYSGFADITDLVIQELDRDIADVDLLAGAAPAATAPGKGE